jgi:lysophospholipase L1-like esterase
MNREGTGPANVPPRTTGRTCRPTVGALLCAGFWLVLLHPTSAPANPSTDGGTSAVSARLYLEEHIVDVAGGPPSDSCTADSASAVRAPKTQIMATRPAPKNTKPDLERLASIGVTGGGDPWKPIDPMALPPQPLEGKAADIKRVGAVLEKAAAGQSVRISIFGDSHTSGGWFSGQIRRVLQDRYGDRGHGFIMPAALYKWYRGTDINLCRSEGWRSDYIGKRGGRKDGLLGFGGMSVSSSDPEDFGWLQTTTRNPQGRAVSVYDIYTLRQPDGGTLLAQVDSATPIEIRTKAAQTGLMLSRIRVPDGPHRLHLSPSGDGEVRILGVSAERDHPGLIVDTIGIRGQQARHTLQWTSELMQPGIEQLSPDLLVLQFGTNEANDTNLDLGRYRAKLRTVIGRFQEAAPEAACLLIGPTDRAVSQGNDQYAVWELTAPVAEVQRQLAPEMGCAFWDWQAATGGPGSILTWRFHSPQLAAKDLIHLKARGYELSANLLIEAIDRAR